MTQRTKQPSLWLTLGAAVLLVGGGGAAYWYFTQRAAGPAEMPAGANLIPQDALMAVSLTTDGAQWQQLRAFGTRESQAAFDQNLVQLRDRLLTANGLDYTADIAPWVGAEMTIAFLPGGLKNAAPPTDGQPTPPVAVNQQATLLILPLQDPLKAQEILSQPRPQLGQLVERDYNGVTIRETQKTGAPNYAIAVLEQKWLVLATDGKALERAIDTVQGAPALAATPGYAQALQRIAGTGSFGKVFVNLPAAAALRPGAGTSPEQVQAQQLQGLAANITLESEGIRFRSIYWLQPDSQRTYAVQNQAGNMPDRLPADTLVMASGGNLQQFWQDFKQGAAVNPVVPFKPDTLEQGLQQTVGLNLEQDLLAWMAGEFSLALVAAPPNASPTLPFSLVFMVQASDRRAGEAALKKLDEAMASRYQFKVEPGQVANQPVVNWSLPAGGPTITHGWLEGDVAFLVLGAPITETLIPKPPEPLAQAEAFQTTASPDLQPNNGHFFVNIDEAVNARKLPLLQLPPGNRELFAAIKAIGVTAAYSSDRSIRFDIFAMLQKAGAPAPLPPPNANPGTPASPTPVPNPSPSPS